MTVAPAGSPSQPAVPTTAAPTLNSQDVQLQVGVGMAVSGALILLIFGAAVVGLMAAS